MAVLTIGFIGLGNMGGPMAANLVKAGHAVRAFDLAEPARAAAGAAGCVVAASAGEASEGADVVVTMLPAGAHVLSVYGDQDGPLARAKSGALVIDCSTIDVAAAREAHALAARAGFASLDAPVSGGVAGAAGATLTFMVGGETEAFARGRDILAAMGRKIVHCGGAGAGQAAKICNNMLLAISMIGASEAFVLGEKLGLTHQALFDVISGASGQCWSVTSYCPVPGPVPASPANNAFKPGFAASLMLKDLSLAMQAARESGAACDLGAHATELYRAFNEAGFAGVDFSGVIADVRGRSG